VGVGFDAHARPQPKEIMDIARIIVAVALGVAWVVEQIFTPTKKK
jgi:hypothetical protein